MDTMTDDDWRDLRGAHPLYLVIAGAVLAIGAALYVPATIALAVLEALS